MVYYDQIQGTTQPEMLKLMSREELINYYLYLSEYCYFALEGEDPGGRMVQVKEILTNKLRKYSTNDLFLLSCIRARFMT